LNLGKIIQNVFTTAKRALFAHSARHRGLRSGAGSANFSDFWTLRGDLRKSAGLTAAAAFGLFVGICVAQTNSLSPPTPEQHPLSRVK
jgi:hypothetical protein